MNKIGRKRSSRRTRIQLAAAFAALLGGLSFVGDDADAEPSYEETQRILKERPAAIRALYGEGLTVKVSADNKKVSVDWGTLDAATYQRYVTEHYLAGAKAVPTKIWNDSQLAFADTYFTDATGAAILIEPMFKLAMCEALANSLADLDLKNEMNDYCVVSAIKSVLAPVVAFRGKAESHQMPAALVGAKLRDPLYDGKPGARDVLITLPGPGESGAFRPNLVAKWVVGKVRFQKDQRLLALGNDLKARAAANLSKAKERIMKRDRKYYKAKGAIVFTDTFVEGWTPFEPLPKSAKPSCYAAYMQIYGPLKKGTYDLTIKAGDEICQNSVVDNAFLKRLSLQGTCKKHLRSGDNKISVVISKNVNKVAGTRWDPKKRRNVKYYSNNPGKVVNKAKIACTLKL